MREVHPQLERDRRLLTLPSERAGASGGEPALLREVLPGVQRKGKASDGACRMMTVKQLENAAKEIAQWLEWDRAALNDFHAYAHKFGATPGSNVYEFALRDALRGHGLTLEQFRSERER